MTADNQSDPSPKEVLTQLVRGFMVSQALQAVAELGIADLLAESPKTPEELALATTTNPTALRRLLRAVAGLGIFRENEAGRFENTALSEPLRTDSPASMRDYIIYSPNAGNVRAWMSLMSVLRTGEPSFAEANGSSLWEYYQQHPDLGERFDRAMTSLSASEIPMILQAYDFSPFKRIIDIGGGQGLLLASILKAHPGMQGTLFELPAVAARAEAYLADQGVDGRYQVIAGDAFKSIPAGFDAYVFKHVLHDWNDEKCAQLLGRCRKATPPHARLVIVDSVMEPRNGPHPAVWGDVHMMVVVGGRERTEDEFRSLLKGAGFSLTMAKPLPAPWLGIVEAVPA